MQDEGNDPFRIRSEDHVLGARDASVTLIEYADFECPYCREAKSVVTELRKRLGRKLSYVFRNFPLEDVHEDAELAARAAEAAANQGMFWEMHDVLFENQDELSEEDLLGYAAELGLDVDQFAEDLESDEVATRVREDVVEGEELGVDSTPTFFINGELYDGSTDVDEMEERINEILSYSDEAA